jgi:hypothetical protein
MGLIGRDGSARGAWRALVPLVAAASLAGCWFQPGFDAHRSGHNGNERGLTLANVATLDQAWSVDLGSAAVLDPVVSRRGLHAVAGNTVYGRKLVDGAALWSDEVMPPTNLEGPNVVSAPSVRGNQVLVPAMSQPVLPDVPVPGTGVHVYDAGTGVEAELLDDVLAGGSATIDGDTLVGNSYLHLIGFDYISSIDVHDLANPTDPQKNWHSIHEFGGFDIQQVTTAAVGADRVVVGVGTRVEVYTRQKPAGCQEPQPGAVFCPTVWDRTFGARATQPALSDDEGTVFVGDATGRLWALAMADGAVRWQAVLNGQLVVAPPTVGDGLVYVAATDRIHAFDADGCGAATCSPLWSAPVAGGPITKQPALAGGVLYVGTESGSVLAFDADGCGAATCSPVWEASTGSSLITGGPIVANGNLVVGTYDGRLVVFRPD